MVDWGIFVLGYGNFGGFVASAAYGALFASCGGLLFKVIAAYERVAGI